jgi:hypothetical protein
MFRKKKVDTMSSIASDENDAGKRLRREYSNKGITNYSISTKPIKAETKDIVGYKRRILQIETPIVPREPRSGTRMSSQGDKSMPIVAFSPHRNHASSELPTIERLDRILKMRRRREMSFRTRSTHCREHFRTPDRKGFDCGDKSNYKLPESLFFPNLYDESNPSPVCQSRFFFNPRPKYNTIKSKRKI